MKNIIRTMCSGLMILCGVVATADHTSPAGSVSRLAYESQELVQTVRYVGLNFNVQQAVERFNFDVLRLSDCAQSYGGIGIRENQFQQGDHIDGPGFIDHTQNFGVPYQCRMNLDMARRSFMPVERFLNDTSYDYPQVYRSYWETREALYSLQVSGFPGPGPIPGPGPQPNQVSCTAVDTGWEEHKGGHIGYGRDVMQAQRMALGQCQRFHGRCRIQQCR